MRLKLKTCLIILFIGFISIGYAQSIYQMPYNINQLSSKYYALQKDSIVKNLKAPKKFEKKATQKMYEGFWDSRVEVMANEIKTNSFIYDDEIFSLINNIIDLLSKKNSEYLATRPLVFLDRSSVANAYSAGLNIIVVNAGIIDFVQSKEELTFILAHEFAHNYFKHSDEAMEKKADWLTSTEYEQALEEIKNSKYGKLSLLKKMSLGYTFDRTKHSRVNEESADSLAVVMLKNAGLPFDAKWLLRLDSTDNHYKTPLNKAVASYFENYALPFDQSWMQKKGGGLSTRNFNFKDTSSIADSLKTHPDCITRYNNNIVKSSSFYTPTPISKSIKEKLNKIISWNLYENLNLTACLYRTFLEKDKGNLDPWYDFMFYNIFFGLLHSSNQLNRFNAISLKPKEFICKDYYKIQTMLEQMSLDDLKNYHNHLRSANFWNALSGEPKALQRFYSGILENSEKGVKHYSIVKEFNEIYPQSLLNENVIHFKN